MQPVITNYEIRILGDTHVGKWKVNYLKNFSLLTSRFCGFSQVSRISELRVMYFVC